MTAYTQIPTIHFLATVCLGRAVWLPTNSPHLQATAQRSPLCPLQRENLCVQRVVHWHNTVLSSSGPRRYSDVWTHHHVAIRPQSPQAWVFQAGVQACLSAHDLPVRAERYINRWVRRRKGGRRSHWAPCPVAWACDLGDFTASSRHSWHLGIDGVQGCCAQSDTADRQRYASSNYVDYFEPYYSRGSKACSANSDL